MTTNIRYCKTITVQQLISYNNLASYYCNKKVHIKRMYFVIKIINDIFILLIIIKLLCNPKSVMEFANLRIHNINS